MTLLSPTHNRIKTIDERLARLCAERLRLAERASLADRKRDTRRKILIGAAVLAALERDGVPHLTSAKELSGWMDAHLTRAHDRAVFDLPSTASTPQKSGTTSSTRAKRKPVEATEAPAEQP